MANYQYVLTQTVRNTPQVWTGTFPDAAVPGWTMVSKEPLSAEMPEWAEAIQALEAK